MVDQPPLLQYPTDYPIKVVGRPSDDFRARVHATMLRHSPKLDADRDELLCSVRASGDRGSGVGHATTASSGCSAASRALRLHNGVISDDEPSRTMNGRWAHREGDPRRALPANP